MKITVIGVGYVGLVTGTCFAEMGNTVTCVDIDAKKIDNLKNGIIPIFEPGLEELVVNNTKANRLLFSSSIKNNIKDSNLFFIAVGTPEGKNGEAEMKYIYNVAQDIGKYIDHKSIIVNKSTVPVGTANQVELIIKKELIKRNIEIPFYVASNPEFLKEGDAIRDFMRPDRVVLGTNDSYTLEVLKKLYSPFTMNHNRLITMGVKEAELTKYAANSMLATKISFINEISNICDQLDIDVEDVRRGIGADSRIGYSFIYPGAGYGGSCFPKDIKAIINTAKKAGIDPIVLNAIEKRNEIQKQQLFKHIIDRFGTKLNGLIFSIWGLSFKPGTDDMREAPSIILIKKLIDCGAIIKAFDPISNKNALNYFPKELIQEKKLLICDNDYIALKDSHGLVLMTEWKMFRNPDFSKMKKLMKKLCIFDGRNQYDPSLVKSKGFEYKGIGR